MTRKKTKQVYYYDSDSSEDSEYTGVPRDLILQENWDRWWNRIEEWARLDNRIGFLGASHIAELLEEPDIPIECLPKEVDSFMWNNLLFFIPWWFKSRIEDPHCIKPRSLIFRIESAADRYVLPRRSPKDPVCAPGIIPKAGK